MSPSNRTLELLTDLLSTLRTLTFILKVIRENNNFKQRSHSDSGLSKDTLMTLGELIV